MERVCVTGGAGFIGSHTVRRLLEAGYAVTVVDNFITGTRMNLEDLGKAIKIIEGDLTDPDVAVEAIAGAAYVIHLAALPSVPRSMKNPAASHHANATATLNVLMAARAHGVRKVVYASSSSVYGDGGDLPQKESVPPAPISPYAASKLAGEYYCRVFDRSFDLPTVVLRYFNVFGPRQDPNSEYAAVIPRFIQCALRNEPLTVYGDGEQGRDFTYVANVVDANISAMLSDARSVVLNVACGRMIRLRELIQTLEHLLRQHLRVEHVPPRPGDIRQSLADISLAREAIGYRPRISFEEGLAETIDWFRRVHRSPDLTSR